MIFVLFSEKVLFHCKVQQNIDVAISETLSNNSKEPYHCHICEANFFQIRYLKEHFKEEHHGENPWKCSICNKTFSTCSHLKRHNSTVHEGKYFDTCSLCDVKFADKRHLKKHMLLMHSDVKDRNDPFRKLPTFS